MKWGKVIEYILLVIWVILMINGAICYLDLTEHAPVIDSIVNETYGGNDTLVSATIMGMYLSAVPLTVIVGLLFFPIIYNYIKFIETILYRWNIFLIDVMNVVATGGYLALVIYTEAVTSYAYGLLNINHIHSSGNIVVTTIGILRLGLILFLIGTGYIIVIRLLVGKKKRGDR